MTEKVEQGRPGNGPYVASATALWAPRPGLRPGDRRRFNLDRKQK